jgi:uncharacterized protein YndB with AHSA1/START domain
MVTYGDNAMKQDEVFKALADPSRRKLLDVLFEQDGQTLLELQAHLPMTRFGCMKHLQILEEAGLITTRKVGREKHHYLNPVPIQLVYDRWVSKYAQPWTQTLALLKNNLEEITMDKKPAHVFQIFIRTTPELLWRALTEGDITRQYYFGSQVESSWKPGEAYCYRNSDGSKLLDGDIVEIDPPRRLVMTFRPLWQGEEESSRLSTVSWEIMQVGATCKLTVTHAGLVPDRSATHGIIEGWGQILSSLKTWLETGEPLIINS